MFLSLSVPLFLLRVWGRDRVALPPQSEWKELNCSTQTSNRTPAGTPGAVHPSTLYDRNRCSNIACLVAGGFPEPPAVRKGFNKGDSCRCRCNRSFCARPQLAIHLPFAARPTRPEFWGNRRHGC